MYAKELLQDPEFLALDDVARAERIRSFLDCLVYRMFRDSTQSTTNAKLRDIVGVLHNEWYQAHIESILDRVGHHINMSAIVAKVNAARHAGLNNEQLGAIFCREYDAEVERNRPRGDA